MRLPRDHPRSRGVYYKEVVDGQPVIGSSPLARGLHFLSPSIRPQAGIIPARAGFTVGRRRARLWAGDHPRSRGVYHEEEAVPLAVAGSSPLARGLRLLLRPRRRMRPDHPRSRGVYESRLVRYGSHPGSSPLARGLRDHSARILAIRRIIPARAGFTR